MIIKKNVPIGYLLNKIKVDLIIVFLIAIVTTILVNQMSDKIPEMPLNIPAFLGTAISILLSFKMAQSYDRWWEARRIWGAIVNDSRSLVLQLQNFTQSSSSEFVVKMAQRQIAWCYALSSRLRGLEPPLKVAAHLEDKEWSEIKDKRHLPLAILQNQMDDIKQLKDSNLISNFEQIQMDSTIVRFTESMGMAERIKNTVFPTTYRYILHLSIYVFLIVLDIALKNFDYIYQIPLLMIIAAIFFLLEKSSTNLQDPFSNDPTDTPMDAICETIESNLKELVDIPFESQKSKKKTFYQM